MKSILLIENDEAQRLFLDVILTSALGEGGYTVKHADRLSRGLVMLRQEQFDVVLLDLSLPDSRGFETFTLTRAEAPRAAIIVLTGDDDEAVGMRAVNEGAQDFLTKGKFPFHVLTRSIRYAIERHRRMQELTDLALIDELTGLYNRRGFMALAWHQMKVAARARQPTSLIFLDLDGMKRINDDLGHQTGNEALVEFAQILRSTYRESDIIARVGGDEFCVLLVDHSAEVEPGRRLRSALDARNASSESAYVLAISIGAVSYDPDHPTSIHDLLERADTAMYEEKRSKKGLRRLLVVDDDLAARTLCEAWLEEDYDVTTTATAAEALEAALRHPPDIVLLDLLLPDGCGLDVARQLGTTRQGRGVPIIVLTASGDEESERESLRAGAADYVTKPVNEEVLRRRIDNVLRRYTRG